VKHTFPSDYKVALQALNQGRPLVLENHSKLSTSIYAFTRTLARLDHMDEPELNRPGLFGRLTGGSRK
jgi:hypothetical protein